MEYRRKCTVCGNVYCYTDSDIKNSNLNSINSTVSAIGAVASIMGGGNLLNAQVFNAQSERYGDKVLLFSVSVVAFWLICICLLDDSSICF